MSYVRGISYSLASWLDDLLDRLAGAIFGRRRKLAKVRVRAG